MKKLLSLLSLVSIGVCMNALCVYGQEETPAERELSEYMESYNQEIHCALKIIAESNEKGLVSEEQIESMWEVNHRIEELDYLMSTEEDFDFLREFCAHNADLRICHFTSKEDFMKTTLGGMTVSHTISCSGPNNTDCNTSVEYFEDQDIKNAECNGDLSTKDAVDTYVRIGNKVYELGQKVAEEQGHAF